MGKLGCECGNAVKDNTDEQIGHHWGIVLVNHLYREALEDASNEINKYLSYRDSGRETEWNNEFFNGFGVPMELPEILTEIMDRSIESKALKYGRCNKCSSLLVQNIKNENKYYRYVPSGPSCLGLE